MATNRTAAPIAARATAWPADAAVAVAAVSRARRPFPNRRWRRPLAGAQDAREPQLRKRQRRRRKRRRAAGAGGGAAAGGAAEEEAERPRADRSRAAPGTR